MRDLTKHGDIATAARLQQTSGLSAEPHVEKCVKQKRTGPRQPRKHPYAYLYINNKEMSEQSQKRKLEAIVEGFKAKHEDLYNLLSGGKHITVTLPGNHFVCAIRMDAVEYRQSRLAKYVSSKSNKHNLVAYMRKPRKDVQRSKISKHEKLRGKDVF